MAKVGKALALAAGYTLYGAPWLVARSYVLLRRAFRFSKTAASIGWRDGLDGLA